MSKVVKYHRNNLSYNFEVCVIPVFFDTCYFWDIPRDILESIEILQLSIVKSGQLFSKEE